jgi:hypothetical protein
MHTLSPKTSENTIRRLSSRWTWFYKFVFPIVWIGGFAFGTLSLFQAPASAYPNHDNPALSFLFATIIGSLMFYALCMRNKVVSVEGPELVISNFFRTIRVPLKNVERVSGSILITPEVVQITFKERTEFGRKIQFMPHMRFFMGFNRSPVAKELRELVEKEVGLPI